MLIFNKALNLSSIDDTYNSRDEKISKEGESIEKSKILGRSIIKWMYNYLKDKHGWKEN